MTTAKQKTRKSNFELLRIVAILMIISFHYVYKAGWDLSLAPLPNVMIINTFMLFGEVGVNLFTLISGYFLISGHFSFRKLASLLLQVLFYNFLSLFLSTGCDLSSFLGALRISDFFPTIFSRYWFATAYVLLYLLSPFLSKGLQALSRKEWLRLIAIMVVLWCILPTFLSLTNNKNNTEIFLFYNRFIWMIVLFTIGGFLRLHMEKPEAAHMSAKHYALAALAVLALAIVLMLAIERHPGFAHRIGIHSATMLWPPNTIPQIIMSVLIFMAFRGLHVSHLTCINVLASTTFGIYLLHDGHLQAILWKDVFKNASHVSSPYLILWIMGSTLAVFLVGATIDLSRQALETQVGKLAETVARTQKR